MLDLNANWQSSVIGIFSKHANTNDFTHSMNLYTSLASKLLMIIEKDSGFYFFLNIDGTKKFTNYCK